MGFACDLSAIGAANRPRYNELITSLRQAIRSRREVPGGFTYELDGGVITLQEAAEWISFLRRCCPFLTFRLGASGERPHWELELTGGEGVKPILTSAGL